MMSKVANLSQYIYIRCCHKYYICQKMDCGCWICDDCHKEAAHHGHNKWIKDKIRYMSSDDKVGMLILNVFLCVT